MWGLHQIGRNNSILVIDASYKTRTARKRPAGEFPTPAAPGMVSESPILAAVENSRIPEP